MAAMGAAPMEPLDLLLIPLGVAIGAFGTLVGAGGGFLLTPALLLLFPDRSPQTISAMSLLVVTANAASGSAGFAFQKRIDYRSGAWFAAAALPGAILGAIVVGYVPRRTFDAIFAAVLVVIGLWLATRRMGGAIQPPIRGRGVLHRELRDRYGIRYIYAFQLWKGVAISAAIGFMSSLLGIGGGVIHVPVMATVLHFPVHIATATSQLVLALTAGEASIVHAVSGTLSFDRTLTQALLLALGAIPGAQIGARYAAKLRGGTILKALAVALVLVGARLALKAARG